MNVMWKLTIEDDEGSQTSLQLASAEYHIGRDEGNNVRLTDRNVSRRHATLKRNGDQSWHLVDHESYNGSFVNGQRVAGTTSLAHADLIQLGDYRIFLTNEEYALAPPAGAGKPAAASVPPPPEYPDRLVVLVGPEPNVECRLDRGVVTIGRSEECTFAINHPSVSRVHAVVHPVAPGRFEILDKESANGLRINGVDMRRKILEGGDVIELGDVQMRYLEQGQAPRVGSEVSQRVRALPADPASGRTIPASERDRRPGKGRWVAVAIGVAALGAGIIALQTRPRGDAPASASPPAPTALAATAPTAAPDDGSNAILEKARAAARANQHAEVLRQIASLPEARRRAPEVTDLADHAANALLGEAAKEPDLDKRGALLKPLLAHPLVNAERKRQANELLKPIETLLPLPANDAVAKNPPGGGKDKDRTALRDAARERDRVGAAPDGGSPSEPGRVASRNLKDQPRDREGVKPAPAPQSPNPGGGEPVDNSQVFKAGGEASLRRSLESRVFGGKGSPGDAKMLAAICRHDGDSSCVQRAQEVLRKQSGE
jgi:pSer/pThr/pTyr-binding forkhead associated (FHA) protein